MAGTRAKAPPKSTKKTANKDDATSPPAGTGAGTVKPGADQQKNQESAQSKDASATTGDANKTPGTQDKTPPASTGDGKDSAPKASDRTRNDAEDVDDETEEVTLESLDQAFRSLISFCEKLQKDQKEDQAKHATQIKNLEEAIDKLKAARHAKKNRSENDDSDSEPSEETFRKWTWSSLTRMGEEFFDLLERPEKSPALVAFFSAPNSRTSGTAPLRWRYNAIRDHPIAGSTFRLMQQELSAGKRPTVTDLSRLVLNEVAALLMVSGEEGLCPLNLRSFLALATTNRKRARTFPEASFLEVEIDSMITSYMRSTLPASLEFQGFPLDMEWATGEKVRSWSQFRRAYTEALDQSRLTIALGHLGPDSSRTGTTELARRHVSASQVASDVQSCAPRRSAVTGVRRPRSNSIFHPGQVYVGDRCLRCGKQGHQVARCPNPPHPNFDAADQNALLREMSYGRIALA